MEQWKGLVYNGLDLSGMYIVSDRGRLKGLKSGKIRKLSINHEGYYFAVISTGSRQDKICIKIHRAVACTFISTDNLELIVNHIDGNKLNNSVDNLEWCTQKENVNHAYNNGLITGVKPVKCINTGHIFRSSREAIIWAGLKSYSALNKYFNQSGRTYCGKHPETNEKLQWELCS